MLWGLFSALVLATICNAHVFSIFAYGFKHWHYQDFVRIYNGSLRFPKIVLRPVRTSQDLLKFTKNYETLLGFTKAYVLWFAMMSVRSYSNLLGFV